MLSSCIQGSFPWTLPLRQLGGPTQLHLGLLHGPAQTLQALQESSALVHSHRAQATRSCDLRSSMRTLATF